MPANPRSLRITDDYRRRLASLVQGTERIARREWRQMDLKNLDASYEPVKRQMRATMEQAQTEAVRLTSGYLSAYLSSELGHSVIGPILVREKYVGKTRTGKPLRAALESPVIGVKVAIKEGRDNPLQNGLTRLLMMVDLDVKHAARQSLSDGLERDRRFVGWKRAITGTCDVCMGAADGSTLPAGTPLDIHPNCECVAEPVVGTAVRLPDRTFPNGVSTGEYLTRESVVDRGNDPLTQLVLRSKVDRSNDDLISARLIDAHRSEGLARPDLVVSPPADPGKVDRFSQIRAKVARGLGAKPLPGSVLREVADIPGYREMTVAERTAATQALGVNRFAVTDVGRVAGKNVLIVDDVVVSGEQARAVRKALLDAGARDVQFVALAHAKSLSVRGGSRVIRLGR